MSTLSWSDVSVCMFFCQASTLLLLHHHHRRSGRVRGFCWVGKCRQRRRATSTQRRQRHAACLALKCVAKCMMCMALCVCVFSTKRSVSMWTEWACALSQKRVANMCGEQKIPQAPVTIVYVSIYSRQDMYVAKISTSILEYIHVLTRVHKETCIHVISNCCLNNSRNVSICISKSSS